MLGSKSANTSNGIVVSQITIMVSGSYGDIAVPVLSSSMKISGVSELTA